MLDASMSQQLSEYLGNLREPVELVASLGDDRRSRDMQALLEEISSLSAKVSVNLEGRDERKPSFIIRRASDTEKWVRFAGLPMGHEFTSLVLALLWAGGHPPKVDADVLDQIRQLEGDYNFEMYFSLSCHNCPEVVQALTLMALTNSRITATLIEGSAFQEEVEDRNVMAVPATFLNGEMFASGKMTIDELLAKIDGNATGRAAARLADKAAFDVLVIGGGPAAVAASVYTARKGFSTGVAAERVGGQLHDTLGIENFISVPYTEGPRLAAQLEAHLAEYDVDVMNAQKAVKLVPAMKNGDHHTIEFEHGGVLKARSIVLATGARWRNLGVPGEQEYRNKGVAYCPHCDGPLYKGKRVAVIGGGNSGVEAAIDLANIVGHVTLLEFENNLRADDILQAKLHRMKNVDVIVSAQTTEIIGDGAKVSGLMFKDRGSGEEKRLDLDGVFVQIGLVPNTEWLRSTSLTLNKFGEIQIDARGETSLPGIFAAGDCTTVPYKQIVTAMGDGSKAALSAFDYMIRTEAKEELLQEAG